MRKRLWQLHSWLGLLAGLGLLVIGITGSLLVFREELEALFQPALTHVKPTPAGRLPLDRLLAEANRQLAGHEVTGWLIQHDEPHRADILYALRHGSDEWLIATLDPYTGRILASPRQSTRTLTGWLLELHYAFFADHSGMIATGILALALCFLGVTGVWIYREFWKHVFTLRWGRGARLLFSDLHKFVGIASVLFNLLLGFTGAYWNLTHVIGEWIAGEPPQPKMERRLYSATLSLDALTTDAARRLPGFRANFISLPAAPNAGITLWGAIEPRGILGGPYGSSIFYNEKTGAHKTTTDLRTAGSWAQIVDTFRPLHFGSFGGLPIKILWALGGLAPGVLAITGFLIWRSRRPRASAQAESTAPATASIREVQEVRP